ncbi:MAG: FeoB-associated Cys-rich membrane protein [Clostridia bacterium]|nr:FeoB-associated Cys-rich membrane protein [Clostridia bacterium]
MENIILIALIVLIIASASFYIYKSKKSGKKCIGCPDSATCNRNCAGCGCGCGDDKTRK